MANSYNPNNSIGKDVTPKVLDAEGKCSTHTSTDKEMKHIACINRALEMFCSFNGLSSLNPSPIDHHSGAHSDTVGVLEPEIPNNLLGSEEPAEYARKQEQLEKQEKINLGRKVVELAALKDGQGAVLDAGSTTLAVWNAYSDQIRERQTLLSFRTNSNQILREWDKSESPAVRETHVSLLGSVPDRAHQALFGGNTNDLLKPEVFRPAAVFIGTSGVKFDPADGILFSYHAGEPERAFKKLLFMCKADCRFILATAQKIGFSGAHAFDLFSIDEIDKAPLFLVTTAPRKPADPNDENAIAEYHQVSEQFNHARDVFHGERMQSRIKEKGIDVQWIILDPVTGEELQAHSQEEPDGIKPKSPVTADS